MSSSLLRDYFEIFDTDRDKMIARADVMSLVRALGYAPSPEEEDQVMKEIKGDLVKMNEVKSAISKVKMHSPKDWHEGIVGVLNSFDKDDSGKIQEAELRQMLNNLGKTHLTNAETDAVMSECIVDSYGYVDYNVLCNTLVNGHPAEKEDK
ncbi:myosin, essential light chain, putative [Entamoeba invadens IP1]|uniref:myosin, essential light chain, putative n=1 Tax=Entamoeba invadens IP1 TaxID=370355 RepID=UPI0002C3DA5F|nr:myosin, essential light chain, putative [Entamoeba invadens IP1]ELP93035.1 myosin, essential light chain, putative [Entamoeba invadens IP1]|eukprot:XP_004259806.1 myosin, essential light chain, putative [Entamoeba invadens IP1]